MKVIDEGIFLKMRALAFAIDSNLEILDADVSVSIEDAQILSEMLVETFQSIEVK